MYSAVLKQTLNKLKLNGIGHRQVFRCLSNHAAEANDDEYTAEPEYPEILDLSFDAKRSRQLRAWHEEVKNVTTVEGKLIKINMPRYYGWKCHMFQEEFGHRYNCLPYYKHWTRTAFKGDIPAEYFGVNAEEETKLVNDIRELIEEAVVFQLKGYR